MKFSNKIWVLVNREIKRNKTGKRNEAISTNLLVPCNHITACVVFSLVLWLAPSLDWVSEVRLMFSVYFLLWQLSIFPLTVVLAI